MTTEELKDVVEQRMADPAVLGRVACNLRSSAAVEQRHHDDHVYNVQWLDDGDYWRCILTEQGSTKPLVQIDLHENATVRADIFAPCRVTVSPEDGILCITRYK